MRQHRLRLFACLVFLLAAASSVLAQLRFETADFLAGNTPNGVVTADFNNDGLLDVANVNLFSNTVSIFLGNGDGLLLPANNISVGNQPIALIAADFNGDGKPDLAIVNRAGNTVAIRLGRGDGTFAAGTTFSSGGTAPVDIRTADFNGDGKADLAVAHQSGVSIFLGDGHGNFAAPISVPLSGGAGALAIGDFDKNCKPDMAAAGAALTLLMNRGAGTFDAVVPTTAFSPTGSIAVGDFNHDGLPDLAFDTESCFRGCVNAVQVLMNNGGMHFTDGAELPGGIGPVVARDFNHDGLIDLFNSGWVYHGKGNGTFDAGESVSLPTFPNGASAGDMNSDGRIDLIVTAGNSVSVLLQNNAAHFPGRLRFADFLGSPYQWMTAADLNHDGILDLVSLGAQNLVGVSLGQGNGNFSAVHTSPLVGGPLWGAVRDFNGDGNNDLAILTSAGLELRKGNGDGTFQPSVVTSISNFPKSLAVADFNHDGHMDAAVSRLGDGKVSVLLGNGDGTFRPEIDSPAANTPWYITAVDVDHDGFPDLLALDSSAHFLNVLRGDGSGHFALIDQHSLPSTPTMATVADFNHDGFADIAIQCDTGIYLSLGGAHGVFSTPVFIANAGVSPISSGDLDGDGNIDLVWDSTILRGKGNGTFQPPQSFASGSGFAAAIVVRDFNGDARSDIATLGDGGIGVALNRGPVDLAVHIAAPASAVVGAPFTFTITVHNNGLRAATEAIVSQLPTSGLKIVSASTSQGYCVAKVNVTCNLKVLASGSTATLRLKVIATHAGTWSDTAKVQDGWAFDNNTTNNNASASTIVH